MSGSGRKNMDQEIRGIVTTKRWTDASGASYKETKVEPSKSGAAKGAASGMAAGGAVGTAVGGPVGGAIGAAIGGAVGGMIGLVFGPKD